MTSDDTRPSRVKAFPSLQGKRVTVMGLGTLGGGVGTVSWLLGQGAIVTMTDLKSETDLRSSLGALAKIGHDIKNVTGVFGEHREQDFVNTDLVVRSAAVRRDSPYLTFALSCGVPVEMDSSLFFLNCPTNDIIGVTGSKGKTTTARAIESVLRFHTEKRNEIFAVGIEGTSPLGMLNLVTKESTVVFELSSWRLEALRAHKLSPSTAVVTSLYHEHLNTYDSFTDYIDVKKIIIRYQLNSDIALLNYDDPLLREWSVEIPSKLYWYSMNSIPSNGIFVRDGAIWICRAGISQELFDVDVLPLHHEHERRNLLPSILIGTLRGMNADNIKNALIAIKSLPHRLEVVENIDDITFINDSAATMPDATIVALHSFQTKNIVLILGGNDKNLSFEKLSEELIHARVRGIVYLPGTATPIIEREITARVSLPSMHVQTMRQAVTAAHKMAKPHDIVLLSPAATSFKSFHNEFDRGDQFRKEVLKLEQSL